MSPTWEIRQGDALDRLREMPDESVHCCVTSPPYFGLRSYIDNGDPRKAQELGIEATPEEYVARMVEVFREVRRVLREDGTCWLNLGDSYAASRSYQVTDQKWRDVGNTKASEVPAGLKPKDLVGIPWRVAFALQADGWWLRSDIIWSKPNPMPESVRDRPTKAHEYVFLLSKSERYFYDADAVAEPHARTWDPRTNGGSLGGTSNRDEATGTSGRANRKHSTPNPTGRNRRSVWEITTRPYPNAHFAVFPPELPRVCIKAGTSQKGCCPECGAPWERVVEVDRAKDPTRHTGRAAVGNGDRMDGDWPRMVTTSRTTGWRPTCSHDGEPAPCTVLDPFSGAGTTGLVALRNGRSFIGIELNPDYVEMANRRLAHDSMTMPDDGWGPTHDDLPLFADTTP